MPTSSQALILQTTNGSLPPIFGRRYWRPRWSIGYPLSNMDMTHRCYVPDSHKGPYNKVPALRRSESAPLLRLDLSTLPQLLQVQGIHGSLAYDKTTNTVRWQVPTIDQLQAIREHDETPSTSFFRTGRTNDHGQFYGANVTNRQAYFPALRKIIRSNEAGHGNKANSTEDVFMRMESNGESTRLVKSDSINAGFFRLVKSETTADKSGNVKITTKFRLVKSFSSEAGSFQLAPTDSGQYQLVPPPGFESDDFRIVQSEKEPGCYILLQADPYNECQYSPVELNAADDREFRLIQARMREPPDNGSNNQEHNKVQAWSGVSRYSNVFRENKGVGFKSSEIPTENNYDFFEDILKETYSQPRIETEMFLPDITLYDSKRSKELHHPNQHAVETNTGITHELEMDSFDNEMDEFRARYADSYQEDSTDVYNRLVNLGFRRADNDTEKKNPSMVNKYTGSSSKYFSSEWKMHNFDQWSRTTDVPLHTSVTAVEPSRNTRFIAPIQSQADANTDQKISLLDDVKLKANYKLWKKKNVTSLRMRKELPLEDPRAVCVSLRDNAISHKRLKHIIEEGTGRQLVSLQFDPVSVHSQDSEAKSQWILRFPDESICKSLIAFGITIDGMKYPVRSLIDVMKDEHDAYKFCLIMKEIKERKAKNQKHENGQKVKSKKVKTMQTQTGMQTTNIAVK